MSFEGNSKFVIGSLVSKADKISLKANAWMQQKKKI